MVFDSISPRAEPCATARCCRRAPGLAMMNSGGATRLFQQQQLRRHCSSSGKAPRGLYHVSQPNLSMHSVCSVRLSSGEVHHPVVLSFFFHCPPALPIVIFFLEPLFHFLCVQRFVTSEVMPENGWPSFFLVRPTSSTQSICRHPEQKTQGLDEQWSLSSGRSRFRSASTGKDCSLRKKENCFEPLRSLEVQAPKVSSVQCRALAPRIWRQKVFSWSVTRMAYENLFNAALSLAQRKRRGYPSVRAHRRFQGRFIAALTLENERFSQGECR